MRQITHILLLCITGFTVSFALQAQQPVRVGAGSYASYAPLAESYSTKHGGCQAYQTEHRRLYLPDSLLSKLSAADGSKEGTLTLPTNDWWTYALVNRWTGKLWFYPGWAEATEAGVEIGYPSYWEPTGSEVKWDTPLQVAFKNTTTGKRAAFTEALVDSWSDFMMSFVLQDDDNWVRVTCMRGSPLVWFEAKGIEMQATNPDTDKFVVFQRTEGGKNWLVAGLLTERLSAETLQQYAWRVPRRTRLDYEIEADKACLKTFFRVFTEDIASGSIGKSLCLMGFLPHHYFSAEDTTNPDVTDNDAIFLRTGGMYLTYLSPRGELRLARGNDFCFKYAIKGFLPYFPAPMQWKEGFSKEKMQEQALAYAQKGTFGADTYWGGKGLTQMMHYMTFALQMGDTATYLLAKKRLRSALEDWYTYTPGEQTTYFARFPRFGALVGFDTSYDSDTFNDHHFHYGYFVYASAVLCMLDKDFREQYGEIAREVAMDYACWERGSNRYPLFRTFDPYSGHSFAGGMGNAGNGNGQESTSESMQAWGGVILLGAALDDTEMLNAGLFGYTVEAKATAEYWFDRHRRNIDYTKYKHPYCCNLTMQGVGWWTWFSGDPVWMHSIQWLPTSPILTNYLSEDLGFARWDYTEMYKGKEIGNYEAAEKGLGDESGLGNVCLSYLALFDADSAAHVWERMNTMGKALAKNTDTGGITYWLAHTHRSLGEKRYDIFSNHPMACVYTDTLSGVTTYVVYNASDVSQKVHFFGAKDTTLTAPANALTLFTDDARADVSRTAIEEEKSEYKPDEMAWNLPYPNLALHKPVEASSAENAGSAATLLTDGDLTTRWGSGHKDGEYAIVDLQQKCYIDHLILRWEAAYASEYEIALSDDKKTWQSIRLSTGGGTEKVDLASAFAAQNQLARGRYIRLTGITRATEFGTSLYELEAYGRPLQGIAGNLFVLSLAATDTVVMQGETVTLSLAAYDALGGRMQIGATMRVTEGEATLQTNRLYCHTDGQVTVTATSGDLSTSLTIVVLEVEQTIGTKVEPAEVTLPIGETQLFTIHTQNQFSMPVDECTESFTATALGDTTLHFLCHDMPAQAVAHVREFSEVNLALGKSVATSGAESDATAAANAVDGDMDTRWSSRFQDGEWIEVDLGDCYRLTEMRLYWEDSYATAYEVLVSEDADTYQTLYSTTNSKGGRESVSLLSEQNEPTAARYVRLVCNKRSSGYGASLWEIEIYGESPCENKDALQDLSAGNENSAVRKYIHNGQLYLLLPNGTLYNAWGTRLK